MVNQEGIGPAPSSTPVARQNGRYVGGATLIVIGLLLLVGQFVRSETIGLLILPLLGGFFLAWGIAVRNPGLMVPGGILSGLGVGVYLIEEQFPYLSGNAEGGVILVSLACGFLAVTLFTALFTNRAHLWPLIPGSIVGFIGGALLSGEEGLRLLLLLNTYWPVILIIIGALLIVRRRN